jgi:hypothetical protein
VSGCGRGKLFASWHLGSREKQERDKVKICPSKACPQCPIFLNQALFSIAYSAMNSYVD